MHVENLEPLLSNSDVPASENKEFQTFLNYAKYAKILGVDTETTGKEYDIRDGSGHAIGLSIAFDYDGYNGFAYYFPFRHDYGNLRHDYLGYLKRLIESKPVTFHHAKHDIVSLGTLGIEVKQSFFCTLLLAHRVWENYSSYQLDWLSKNVLGREGKERGNNFDKMIQVFGWAGSPPNRMASYAAQDAIEHYELWKHFWPIHEEEDESEGQNWEYEKEFVHTLITMEKLGIKVDLKLAEQQIWLGELRQQEIVDEIGYDLSSRNDLNELFLNELKLPILKKSPKTDKPSFDKSVMEQYEEILSNRSEDHTVQAVLEFRGFQKAVSTYWKSYLKFVSGDGRLRPHFNQHRSVNGRLSCSEPNGQNIPRVSDKPWNKKIKAGFIPEEGYLLWDFDYSQLEMRLQAAYSKEPKLLEIFNDDTRDLFSEMAADLGETRYDTKQVNYALGYGAQPKKIAQMLGKPVWKTQQIYDNYYRTYPGLRLINDIAKATAEGQGFIRYWTTRRRHYEDPFKESRKALNSVMQGGAAEIVKRQMIRVRQEVDPECRMLLQVHDSLMFEIPIGKEEIYNPQIKKIMEDVQPDFGIPFKVDIKPWGT